MNIRIAYLYYDLLNLYGDNGNIKALNSHLKEQNVKVKIDYLSIDDEIDFSSYDVIYMGSGTTHNLIIALNNLKKYRNDLNKYINDNKVIICTGNSFELFGSTIKINDKVYNGLNILNFYTTYLKERIVKDSCYECSFLKNKVIGFENHFGSIVNNEDTFFYDEGVIKNNFYGTYLIGPLLIRNPKLCKYFIKTIIKNKNRFYKMKKGNYKLEDVAYKKTIENLI